MGLRFQIIEVGWGTDFDNNRHPRIRMRRGNWSAVLYDHPSEGWQMISLAIIRKTKSAPLIDEYDRDAADSKFRELIGGELLFANTGLDAITNDLYEFGQKGAMKRWGGNVITLHVENPQ